MPWSPEAAAGFVPAAHAGAPAPVDRFARTGAARPLRGALPGDGHAAARAAGWAAGRAEALLAVAREEAARQQAHADQARREAEAATAARQRALAAVQHAAADRAAEDAELADAVTTLVLDLAADLAVALVGATAPVDRATAAVRRALDAAGEDAGTLLVRLHPADLQVLGGPAAVPGAELRADPSLRPGDAVASAGATRVDARVRDAVHRALAALAAPTGAAASDLAAGEGS